MIETSTRNQTSGAVAVLYAGSVYLLFLLVAGYAVAFLADAWVPRTVSFGGPTHGGVLAVVVDALLLSLFAMQHSVMARPAFKRWWGRLVPTHLERATYVLATNLVLVLLFWQWRPLPDTIWDLQPDALRAVLWAVYLLGWVLAVAMTFAFDHAEFMGLKQPLRRRSGVAGSAPALKSPLPYRLVRHPMMTGFLIAFWVTPTMTLGHLLFATLASGYILVGSRLEERDLAATLQGYAKYAARTPRFVPRPRPRSRTARTRSPH